MSFPTQTLIFILACDEQSDLQLSQVDAIAASSAVIISDWSDLTLNGSAPCAVALKADSPANARLTNAVTSFETITDYYVHV